MSNDTNPENTEFWLQGPVEGIPSLLQPAAHALLQSEKELGEYLKDFPKELLWKKVGGRASVGFHIQHIIGVLDRMMTYSEGKSLSEEQFNYLEKEGEKDDNLQVGDLQFQFSNQVRKALTYFQNISEEKLKEKRTVGRKKLPSTVLGLLFHAAEHGQRHIGQLLVTTSILTNSVENKNQI